MKMEMKVPFEANITCTITTFLLHIHFKITTAYSKMVTSDMFLLFERAKLLSNF